MHTPDDAASLMARLEAMPLCDVHTPLAFERKLADEQGWTLGYTSQVVREYRRFVWLSQVAGHPVCPSEQVDAAWHLHLTHTRAYRAMCDQILGRFLHHDPARGDAQDATRHREMYAATLRSYLRLFAQPAPPHIWPALAQRFAPPAPRTPAPQAGLRTSSSLAWMLLVGSFVLGMVAHASGLLQGLHDLPGPVYVRYYMLGLLCVIGVAWLTRHPSMDVPPQWAELDPYEAALIKAGPTRVGGTALVTLVQRGLLRLLPERNEAQAITGARIERTGQKAEWPQLHPAEAACLFEPAGRVLSRSAVDDNCCDIACRDIGHRLQGLGLLDQGERVGLRTALLLGMLACMVMAAVDRLLLSVGTPHPVLYLVLELAFNLVVMGRMASHSPRVSAMGQAALAHTERQHQAATNPDQKQPRVPPDPALLTMSFALLGSAAVMADPRFAGINFAVRPTECTGYSHSTGACGGGTGGSCSGGGDGGGCGGGCGGGGGD